MQFCPRFSSQTAAIPPWSRIDGALFQQELFTKYYGKTVAGLVFVDASHPMQAKRIKQKIPSFSDGKITPLKKFIMKAMAGTGVLRMILSLSGGLPNHPPRTIPPWISFASASPGLFDELENLDSIFSEYTAFIAKSKGPVFKNRPFYILTAMAPLRKDELFQMGGLTEKDGVTLKKIWKTMHSEYTTWSSNSKHTLVPDAGHYIQFDRPNIIISAIQWTLAETRK